MEVFIPHVDQIPYTLEPIGRKEATVHDKAYFSIEPLRIGKRPSSHKLPVAALPLYGKEVFTVHRTKKRPAIIISEGGAEVASHLRIGKPKWQTSPTVIVVPYYGADEGYTRAGFNPEFIKRVQRCEYPQYVWDKLPISGSSESILRLDHLQPVGRHHDSVEFTKYILSAQAIAILDDWLEWLIEGEFSEDNALGGIRDDLLNLP